MDNIEMLELYKYKEKIGFNFTSKNANYFLLVNNRKTRPYVQSYYRLIGRIEFFDVHYKYLIISSKIKTKIYGKGTLICNFRRSINDLDYYNELMNKIYEYE